MSSCNPPCERDLRRDRVRTNNRCGLDYVEVELVDKDDNPLPQPLLHLYFFGNAPTNVVPANIQIAGGRRIRGRDIRIVNVSRPAEDRLLVTVDAAGDFSPYTLALVDNEDGTESILHEVDECYRQVSFLFRAQCAASLDCAAAGDASEPPPLEPEINYLAKDYASFRQLIFDRLAVVAPDWKERHAADIGVMLVELLAYAGDQLSYYQDAVATEAYLDTARQRISVRRHARLVDYRMHEGCNARTVVCVTPSSAATLLASDVFFVTACRELAPRLGQVLREEEIAPLGSSQYEIFEPIYERKDAEIRLWPSHGEIEIYTWGGHECCLPRGSTRATLRDGVRDVDALQLRAGDLLLFEEVRSPRTGAEADADPLHRHVVRLTKVERGEDDLEHQPIVEVEWELADALPFDLTLSATLPAPDCRRIEPISVARGNVVAVDHGRRVVDELPPVPIVEVSGECACDGGFVDSTEQPGPFRVALAKTPLTYRQALPARAPAAHLWQQDPRRSLPQVVLVPEGEEDLPPGKKRRRHPRATCWTAVYDLLDSDADDPHFVVELDDNGVAHLRFGDGELGDHPDAGTRLLAQYRIGNGAAGNVGAEAIRHIGLRQQSLSGVAVHVRNPLPAQGGKPAESVAEVKRLAPHAFRSDLQRAITGADYALLAERGARVQRATANLCWTGSWFEAQVAVDPLASEESDDELCRTVEGSLHAYRRMGHDLRVVAAQYVPLHVTLHVCVQPHYLRAHVEAALRDRFSSRVLAGGDKGAFHPDNLSFGEGITESTLVAVARAVPGVLAASVKVLERVDRPGPKSDDGILRLGRNEVAQINSDPSFPERGSLEFELEGGRAV